MSHEARFEYLKKIQFEYLNSARRRKTDLLNHAGMVTGLSRKHLTRLLNRATIEHGAKQVRRGRPRRYGPDLEKHLQRLWLAMEQPCGKKMAVLLLVVIEKYRRHAPDLKRIVLSKPLSWGRRGPGLLSGGGFQDLRT